MAGRLRLGSGSASLRERSAERCLARGARSLGADRKGQITHTLAMRVSDSQWHRQLSEPQSGGLDNDPYWLHPFQNYQNCLYLVGSYQRVAEELGRYLRAGVSTVILDVPASGEELEHISVAFADSRRLAHA